MKKILLFLIVLIVSAAVVATQYPLLLTRYARLFSVDNATPGADALVVLAGGIIPRLPYAIELYQQGYAPRIILTEARHPNPRFRQVWNGEWSIAPGIISFLNVKVNLVYQLQFVLAYEKDDFHYTLDMLAQERLDPSALITDRVGLAGVPAAFEALATPQGQGKVLACPAL